MKTFNKTIKGYFHILKNIECEDYSLSLSVENDNVDYYIAIVADGHGSESCFRSSKGSKFVVEATKECLNEFAVSTVNVSYKTVKILTDSILAKWYDKVYEDLKLEFSENEQKLLSKYYKFDLKDKTLKDEDLLKYCDKLQHIYGTTLIAALRLQEYLILIQQGDGRCSVLYENGKMNQPIPWDERCIDNVTTSICDIDANDRIRTCIIDLKKEPVIACFLCSDGVEDSFRDTYESIQDTKKHSLMGGVYTYFKDLLLNFNKYQTNNEEFDKYLDIIANKVSKEGVFGSKGSGDDVSIACIVDETKIGKYLNNFDKDVKIYTYEEEIARKESELRGKTRKREKLKREAFDINRKYDEIEENISEEEKRFEREEYQPLVLEQSIKEKGLEELEKQLRCFIEQNEEYKKHPIDSDYNKSLVGDFSGFVSDFISNINQKYQELVKKFHLARDSYEKLINDPEYKNLKEEFKDKDFDNDIYCLTSYIYEIENEIKNKGIEIVELEKNGINEDYRAELKSQIHYLKNRKTDFEKNLKDLTSKKDILDEFRKKEESLKKDISPSNKRLINFSVNKAITTKTYDEILNDEKNESEEIKTIINEFINNVENYIKNKEDEIKSLRDEVEEIKNKKAEKEKKLEKIKEELLKLKNKKEVDNSISEYNEYDKVYKRIENEINDLKSKIRQLEEE